MSERIYRINTRRKENVEKANAYVYRYTDISDGIIKYVGIVHKSSLDKRLSDHAYRDDWCKGHNWKVEYFCCNNRSEAEAFESHLIAKYKTWKYYNKSKAGWGENSFLPNVEDKWKEATVTPFADYETLEASIEFRKLLRSGHAKEARQLINFIFEFHD